MPVFAQHPHLGPRDPVPLTIARVPGSTRRTTVVDIVRPHGLSGDLVLEGSGRDVRTTTAGGTDVLDEATLHVEIDFLGGRVVRAIRSEPRVPGLAALIGARAASGFRRAASTAAPQHAAARDLLHQLLDEVPAASLIAGYAVSALGAERTLLAARLHNKADICAGFQSGGSMMQLVADAGRVPAVVGPIAPDVAGGDPDSWPELALLPPGAMRRRRLLDVAPGATAGEVGVFAWFRDTFRHPDGAETVLHEYHLDATVDTGGWRILGATAAPHVLPWPECPQAAGSAERLVGATLQDLREEVRAGFVGTATCTHLNDQLRSLADVPALAPVCARPS